MVLSFFEQAPPSKYTCSWWWFRRNLTRLVARGGNSDLIFHPNFSLFCPNLFRGSMNLLVGQVCPNFFLQISHWFIALDPDWMIRWVGSDFSTWSTGGSHEQVGVKVNQSSLNVYKFDWLFEFVGFHPFWTASKTSGFSTLLILSVPKDGGLVLRSPENGTLSLVHLPTKVMMALPSRCGRLKNLIWIENL